MHYEGNIYHGWAQPVPLVSLTGYDSDDEPEAVEVHLNAEQLRQDNFC